MFTGIITHIGKLEKKENNIFAFSASRDLIEKLKKSESIAVNGCCLTIENLSSEMFSVEVMPETQQKTMLGLLKHGGVVNLELPVSANSLLSGHIVQGHIDGTGVIKTIQENKNSRLLTITLPKKLHRYVVEKGSVCINGVSLTVINTGNDYFTVGIIPYTWKHTMFHILKIGEQVNIEVDILAKYVEKLLAK